MMQALLSPRLTAVFGLAACSCSTGKSFAGTEFAFETSSESPARVADLLEARVKDRGHADAYAVRRGSSILIRIPGLSGTSRETSEDWLYSDYPLLFRLVAKDDGYMNHLAARVTHEDKDLADSLGIRAEGGALWANNRAVWLSVEQARERGCLAAPNTATAGKVECIVTGKEALSEYVAAVAAREPQLEPDADHTIYSEFLGAVGEPVWRTHYLERKPFLSGRDLVWADLLFDEVGLMPRAVAQLTPEGSVRLARATRGHQGWQLAVCSGDSVFSIYPVPEQSLQARLELPVVSAPPDALRREAMDLLGLLRGGIPLGLRLKSWRFVGSS